MLIVAGYGSSVGGSSVTGSEVGGSFVGGSSVGGSSVGGSAVGGSAVGGSAVGGSAVGGAEVGGSEVGGSAVGGFGLLLPLEEPFDCPEVGVFVATAGEVDVGANVARLTAVGVVVDLKVGISPGVLMALAPSTVPVAP